MFNNYNRLLANVNQHQHQLTHESNQFLLIHGTFGNQTQLFQASKTKTKNATLDAEM